MKRPNVIVIYTDQQRFDTIHALGNNVIKTPAFDRLVQEGTAFSQATTPCPASMPARWSLHTGQWTTNHRCYSNHHPSSVPAFSMPEILKNSGYITGLIGKNHSFLTTKDVPYLDEHPKPKNAHAAKMREKWIQEVGKENYPRLCREPVPGGLQADPDFIKTEAAIQFVKQAKNDPFFLWLSYEHPHTPYYAPEPFFSMYKNADIPKPAKEEDLKSAGKPFRQQFHQLNNDALLKYDDETIKLMRQVYYGMISLVDREVGQFLDFLESQRLLEYTLIIFMSDHGDYTGDHGLITKSPSLYDCLVRTPLIMRLPDAIPAGHVSDELASHIDVFPTVMNLTRCFSPACVDGIDLLPYLQQEKTGLREYVFSEYGTPGEAFSPEKISERQINPGHYTNPGDPNLPWEANPVSLSGRIRMIKNKDWKLVEETSGPGELYDLKSDPNELVNLFGKTEYAQTQLELQKNLDNWKETVEA